MKISSRGSSTNAIRRPPAQDLPSSKPSTPNASQKPDATKPSTPNAPNATQKPDATKPSTPNAPNAPQKPDSRFSKSSLLDAATALPDLASPFLAGAGQVSDLASSFQAGAGQLPGAMPFSPSLPGGAQLPGSTASSPLMQSLQTDGFSPAGGSKTESLGKLLEGVVSVISSLTELVQAATQGVQAVSQGVQGVAQGVTGVVGAVGTAGSSLLGGALGQGSADPTANMNQAPTIE
ncbi:hypothetical protein JYK02_34660 [Corallococcus macrosporus]|uniref:Uncharacterized protein n=1 Tax=Corallococcus macrosporus TaxID=35 RepID=A0ABS3DN04_9BACT|nr:hypothetical protein [Corallococcus macrosporus]MBN8232672.1 hypothetical protein [Corallococcus macrosporus]